MRRPQSFALSDVEGSDRGASRRKSVYDDSPKSEFECVEYLAGIDDASGDGKDAVMEHARMVLEALGVQWS